MLLLLLLLLLQLLMRLLTVACDAAIITTRPVVTEITVVPRKMYVKMTEMKTMMTVYIRLGLGTTGRMVNYSYWGLYCITLM